MSAMLSRGINVGHRLAAEINAASMNVESEKAKVKAAYGAYGIGQSGLGRRSALSSLT